MSNAVIENGIVVNLIEGSAPGLQTVPNDGTAQIGGTWDGVAFYPASPVVIVPAAVTRRQGMAVLIKYGLDAQIQGALQAQINAATTSGDAAALLTARLAMNDYRESQQFERKWPLIAAMRVGFGWTDAYVDGLFIEAATL